MSYAKREAFSRVPETCPAIDKALAEAEEVIKEQTNALRAALIDALNELADCEERENDLIAEVEQLRDVISNHERAINA